MQTYQKELETENGRLRAFLTLIRENSRSGPFARTMASTALEGTMAPLKAQEYWQAHTSPEA